MNEVSPTGNTSSTGLNSRVHRVEFCAVCVCVCVCQCVEVCVCVFKRMQSVWPCTRVFPVACLWPLPRSRSLRAHALGRPHRCPTDGTLRSFVAALRLNFHLFVQRSKSSSVSRRSRKSVTRVDPVQPLVGFPAACPWLQPRGRSLLPLLPGFPLHCLPNSPGTLQSYVAAPGPPIVPAIC